MQDEQPPNNLQQQSPSTPQPKKRFSPQAIVIVILSLLLLGTASALTYTLISQDKNDEAQNTTKTKDTTNEEEKTAEEVDKEATPPVKDEYEGWKTYSKDWKELAPEGVGTLDVDTPINMFIDYRFPDAGWTQNVFSGCIGPFSDESSNFVCLPVYSDGQTRGSLESQLASGDYIKYKDLVIDGRHAVMISSTSTNPDERKDYLIYVDEISNDSTQQDLVFACILDNKDITTHASFLQDCEKLITSIKFL